MRLKTLSLVLLLILVGQSAAKAELPPLPPAVGAMIKISQSKNLSIDQKTEQLLPYLQDEQWRVSAIYFLLEVNPQTGIDRGIALFRDEHLPRPDRILIGRYLITTQDPTHPERLKTFTNEYARFLVDQALDDGQQQLMSPSDGQEPTAIGELGYIAANYMEYKGVDFTPFSDPRLIPILTTGLDAPDNVYPKYPVGCVVGVPGESTGQNFDRLFIPLSLAKLNATGSVPALRRVLNTHHEWDLRDYAAYALGAMEDPSEHAGLIASLLAGHKPDDKHVPKRTAEDRYGHLFAFGRGLIRRGDDAGIQFMAFEYASYPVDALGYSLPDRIGMLQERLDVLKDFHSPKVEGFIRQVLDDPQFKRVYMADRKCPLPDSYRTLKDAYRAIHTSFDSLCTIIENNKTQSIPSLEIIARDSADPVIRQRAKRCIDNLTITQ